MTRIAATADLHGFLPAPGALPECDILVLSGDLCPARMDKHFVAWRHTHGIAFPEHPGRLVHSPEYQAHWLDTVMRPWLETIIHNGIARRIVAIAGNHDFLFQQRPDLVPADLPWTYLQDSSATIDGLKVYGSPWTPPFGDWAFMADDDERRRRWDAIPDDTDVLVLHGPPHGVGDGVPRNSGFAGHAPEIDHVGCEIIRRRIEAIAPAGKLKLVTFGHVHEGRGQWHIWPARAFAINVSLLDEHYHPAMEPAVITV